MMKTNSLRDNATEPTLGLLDDEEMSIPVSADITSGGQYTSAYSNGNDNTDAANIYLEQLYYNIHQDFPGKMAFRLLKAKNYSFLRKASFAIEKFDAVILGDDPLVSLCAAYSLAKNSKYRVLIVPTIERLPEGDTRENHFRRVRDMYDESRIGNFIRHYFKLSPQADFSDYEAAIFTLTQACQGLNGEGQRVMMAYQYSLMTERTDAYQLQDERDENLMHQLFYAIPKDDLSLALFSTDWEFIRRELLVHTLPDAAYEDNDFITEVIAKQVYVTSPLPLNLDGQIMCQHYQMASGLQSVSQVINHSHTGFGLPQRFLDIMSGAGADLFARDQINAQDYIRKYSTITLEDIS